MTAHNDITGDRIATKDVTEKFREGWDRIFGGSKIPKPRSLDESLEPLDLETSEPKIKPRYPEADDEGNAAD